MEDPLGSIFSYQDSCDQLRQKLVDTMLELETMKNMKTELLKLLKMAYRERDQAREQLQCLLKKLVPSTSNMVLEIQHIEHNNLVILQTKANSSISESNSPSHVSSPVDSFFETVSSSPEFSNVNVNVVDVASAVIDCLANGKVLPQNGKFLEAVMNSGPLLQNLILADSLPTWRNPPPLSAIKIPPLSVKDFGDLNTFPKLNLAGACSNNNPRQLTTGSSSLKKQRL